MGDDMSTQQGNDSGGSWNLIPLTPKYLPTEHGHYVTAIKAALEDSQIHNIALSGNFGVGKSSILKEFAQQKSRRVVELSLSTLAPIAASQTDKSVPIQATSTTNLIQQEIVKQLIYREDPGKTPASRFRRIERFRIFPAVCFSIILGLVITTTFLVRGWTEKLAATFSFLGEMDVWIHLLILGMTAGAVLLARWWLYGKLFIKQLSAGSATVSLNETSVSYFDQYLDEIVYFFEVSKRDIVIFEDIDRFNDSHIFETLRALNTLLNASPQIKKPIRFIYAIKDSIFDRIGLDAEGRNVGPASSEMDDPALVESIRANRTKFFDLVIPVVPFITHRSARNLALQLLDGINSEVVPELLDLAAQYVPDMRLLKNVRNEFIIFRDRIFSGDGKQLKLSETDLFAMMLYKSTHMTDFESIRLGNSKLDTLYKVSRELVTSNIKRLESEIRECHRKLTRIDGAAGRSTQLAKRLLAYVQRTVQCANWARLEGTFTLAGAAYSPNDLNETQFWTDLISAPANPVLQWRGGSYNQALSFSRDDLITVLGDPLDAESWSKSDRESLTAQIDEKSDDIKFLRGADLGDLTKRLEFLVKHEGTDQSLDAIARAILKDGLAYQLVRYGYINRNFTLYTSTFHGYRVGSAATNFIIHHIERDMMDEHFALDPKDVDAIIRERGKDALKEPALYNIAILDHLLTSTPAAADIMVRSLVGFGESQTRFMQAYLSAGKQRLQFIERFMAVSSRVLIYLASQADLDDALRLELMNVALANLSKQKQSIDAAVSEYLVTQYAAFTTLTSEAIEPVVAERVAAMFESANVVVPRLEPLSVQVCGAFVSLDLYEITHENLSIAIDNKVTVALDVIRANKERVYDYVLKHLSTYLGAIEGKSSTIDESKDFISVIEDVLEHEASLLGEVVKRADPVCKVADIEEVSEGAWPALAEHMRFPATLNNVSRYFISLKSVDEHLAKILTATGEITEINATDDEVKTKLAKAILAEKNLLPSAELRVALVASLMLDYYIANVEVEFGNFFALLLKHDIIKDAAENYGRLAETDWPTRKAFICASNKFTSYMTPELLRPDLAALLKSDEISLEIKRAIADQAAAYAEVADTAGLTELAQFATRNEHKLTADVVQKMAQAGIETQQVVMLLAPHLTSISREQLFAILNKLDGDYPSLSQVGHGKPKIPNTPANLALLKRLRTEKIVSKYDENESPIKVHKRYTE